MKLLITIAFVLTSLIAQAADKKCTDYSQFTDLSQSEMEKLVKEKSATIIDVNSKESFAKNNIPGSMHFAAIEKELTAKLPKDKNTMIVTYCGGKMCTAWQKAAKEACELGYTNIHHYSEGITGWTKATKSKTI